jgi:hypothetical protein
MAEEMQATRFTRYVLAFFLLHTFLIGLQTLGQTLPGLYFAQVAIGILIHFKGRPARIFCRPLKNYFHAVLDILIITLSFYQVHTGYKDEFEDYTGHTVPKSVNSSWLALVIVSIDERHSLGWKLTRNRVSQFCISWVLPYYRDSIDNRVRICLNAQIIISFIPHP